MTRVRPLPRRAIRILFAGVLIALTSAQSVYAQVTLNFVNADIDQVAKAIGAATGKTIIVDPRVKGQLNLVSENPVSEDQALKTMQSALRMQGFALVRDHGVLKVVPEADAKLQGVPTFVGNRPQASGDQIVTQVFQLRHESANNLLPILRPLISPNNTISSYPGNNTLVVTDYADNVRRLATIIAGIDDAAGRQVEVVPLKNANALDLAPQLEKMLDPGTIGNTDATLKVNVLADPRTNSLLLRASDASRMQAAKALIKQLDAPTAEPGNIHVVPLRNASAVDLAKTLRGMLGQSSGASTANSAGNSFNQSGASGSGLGTGTAGQPPLPASTLGGTSAAGTGSLGGGSSYGIGQSRDSGFDKKQDSGEDNQPGGMIQADPATNSLIITASEPVYRNLRSVIDQLDARRAQVYIEALIVDMTVSDNAQLGIQWQGALLSGSSNNALVGGTNYGGITTPGSGNIIGITGATASGSSAALQSGAALLQNGLNVGYLHKFGNILGVGGLLNALSAMSGANVLSTPNLITLDNEEAKIMVGSNVPIVSGSYATPTSSNSSGNVTTFNTIDRQDVGIVLHIKPQITEGGILKLQIYQEDSAVLAGTATASNGPTITKRSISSTVLANDGQIIVLGGLIQDNYADSNSKVPWLGDIPLLGALFRSENKARTKTNLMVFLRPVILRDDQTASTVSLNRYDYMRAASGNYQSDNWWSRDKDVPQPPPAPPGPEQGAVPAENLFDLTKMTRPPGQGTLPAKPQPEPPQSPASAPAPAVGTAPGSDVDGTTRP